MNLVELALATHTLITSLCETKIQTRRRLGMYINKCNYLVHTIIVLR